MQKTKKPAPSRQPIKRDPDLLKELGKEIFANDIGSVYVDGRGFKILMNGKIVVVDPHGPMPEGLSVFIAEFAKEMVR